jgi:hypothetical protein
VADYTWVDRCLPPNYLQLILDATPVGMQWYELRNHHRLISFSIDQYDQAVKAGKRLNKIFPSCQLFYMYRDKELIREIQIY